MQGMAPRNSDQAREVHGFNGGKPSHSFQAMAANQKMDNMSSDLLSMALKNSQAMAANLKVDKVSSDLQGMALRNLKMDRVSLNFSEHQGSAEKPFYLRLQENIQWWEKHAPAATTNLIRHKKHTFSEKNDTWVPQ